MRLLLLQLLWGQARPLPWLPRLLSLRLPVGPMERSGALRGLGQYGGASLGLRMGPLWEPYGALQGPYGALWGSTGAAVI